MGAGQSIEVPGGGTEGYHVLRVQDGSPGQKAGLESFFDFIVAIGNTRLDQDNETLKELLKINTDKPIRMTVYSSKTQSVREVSITPSSNWGGQGQLGVSIRFCSFEGANENVWHVLEVHPSSPAEQAGLRAFTDYIIGAEAIRHESDDLFTLIETHEGQALKMYVYNVDDDACREVTLKPNSKWGGEGSLGCGIGYGYLHRIPVRALPEESKSLLKSPVIPDVPQSTELQAPASLANTTVSPSFPYVPPLTNTFTTTPTTTQTSVPPPAALPVSVTSQAFSTSSTDTSSVPANEPIMSTTTGTTMATTSGSLFGTTDSTKELLPPTSIPGATQSAPSNSESVSNVNTNIVNNAQPPSVPAIPMFSPQQFSHLPPPSSLPNLPGFDTTPSYNTATQVNNPAYLSYPAAMIQQPQQPGQPQSGNVNFPQPHMQTYSSYPQVQQVSVPISLPGMPAITVNTTIPTQTLQSFQYQNLTSHQN